MEYTDLHICTVEHPFINVELDVHYSGGVFIKLLRISVKLRELRVF